MLSRQERRQVAWIPNYLATEGGYVNIEGEDGWHVDKVGVWVRQPPDNHGYLAGGVYHRA